MTILILQNLNTTTSKCHKDGNHTNKKNLKAQNLTQVMIRGAIWYRILKKTQEKKPVSRKKERKKKKKNRPARSQRRRKRSGEEKKLRGNRRRHGEAARGACGRGQICGGRRVRPSNSRGSSRGSSSASSSAPASSPPSSSAAGGCFNLHLPSNSEKIGEGEEALVGSNRRGKQLAQARLVGNTTRKRETRVWASSLYSLLVNEVALVLFKESCFLFFVFLSRCG